jgi:hypothetical protein
MRVTLTRKGDQQVIELTKAHLAELRALAAVLAEIAPGGEAAGQDIVASATAT